MDAYVMPLQRVRERGEEEGRALLLTGGGGQQARPEWTLAHNMANESNGGTDDGQVVRPSVRG